MQRLCSGAAVAALALAGDPADAADDVDAALDAGELKFSLEGVKLKGSWVLVRTGGRWGSASGSGEMRAPLDFNVFVFGDLTGMPDSGGPVAAGGLRAVLEAGDRGVSCDHTGVGLYQGGSIVRQRQKGEAAPGGRSVAQVEREAAGFQGRSIVGDRLPHVDPRLLFALWLYATTQGVTSARAARTDPTRAAIWSAAQG